MQKKENIDIAQENDDFPEKPEKPEKKDKPETGQGASAGISDDDSPVIDIKLKPALPEPQKKKISKSELKSKWKREKETLVNEKTQLYDQLLRNQAEQENFKKRIIKETAARVKYANKSLMTDILPVLDNLKRALDSSLNHDDANSLKQGVELTLKQIQDVLSKAGLSQVKAVGEPFDPARHEAVLQLESDEHEHNTVIQEHQKGYFLHDQILRPAMVTVAKNKVTDEKNNQGE